MRGGKRIAGPGKRIGRPPSGVYPDTGTVIAELLFPCVCTAWKAAPAEFNTGLLWFTLSTTDIRLAYGPKGLSEFKKHFYVKKRGGRTVTGVGYKTTWCVRLGSYLLAKQLVESLGHSLNDLPNVKVPTEAMMERVMKAKERSHGSTKKRNH